VSGSDVQIFQLFTAPGEIGGELGGIDDALAVSGLFKDVNSSGATAIDISFNVDLHAVGNAGLVTGNACEQPAVIDGPVSSNIKDSDVLLISVIDVQKRFVRGEAKAVRFLKVIDQQRQLRGLGVQAVHALKTQLLTTLDAKYCRSARVRVGEINATVTFNNDVIRTVEFGAFVMRCEHFDIVAARPASHSAGGVFAAQQTSAPIPGVAVGHVTGFA